MLFLRRLGGLARCLVRSLRGHDLALYSAGVTFFAGIALVPSVLLAVWLTARLVGPERVAELSRSLAEALPDALGAPRLAESTVEAGLRLPVLGVLAVLFPASFYGEGLRRAFVSLADADDTLIGWRGRLLVLPLFAAAPVLLLVVLLITPTLARLFGAGGASAVLGVVLAFLTDWVVLSLALAWVYRVVGPIRPSWLAAAWGAAATGSFLAGFVQGFVLFLAIPLDLGLPFGGFTVVGGAVAVGLWLYLLHLVVLVGYGLTCRIDERGGVPWAAHRPELSRRVPEVPRNRRGEDREDARPDRRGDVRGVVGLPAAARRVLRRRPAAGAAERDDGHRGRRAGRGR